MYWKPWEESEVWNTHSQTKTTNAGIEHDFKCHSCLGPGHLVDYKGAIKQSLKHMWTNVTPLYVLQCPGTHMAALPQPSAREFQGPVAIISNWITGFQERICHGKHRYPLKAKHRESQLGSVDGIPWHRATNFSWGFACGLTCRKGSLLSEEPEGNLKLCQGVGLRCPLVSVKDLRVSRKSHVILTQHLSSFVIAGGCSSEGLKQQQRQKQTTQQQQQQ